MKNILSKIHAKGVKFKKNLSKFTPKGAKMFEKIFEKALMKCRIVTILPVVFGLFGAFVLFFIASYDIIKVIIHTFDYFILPNSAIDLHEDIVGQIIGAVDLYLMALVLFIFSFGIYELFVSEIEELKTLKGIGEGKAQAIIDYRKDHNFTSIEEIKQVKGIGDKLFQGIKNDIVIK